MSNEPIWAHEVLEQMQRQWLDFANKAARALNTWLEANEDVLEDFMQAMYEWELNDPPPEQEWDIFW